MKENVKYASKAQSQWHYQQVFDFCASFKQTHYEP